MVCLVKRWWDGLVDLKGLNQTYVSLILKCHDPKSLKDYRPISCCNVIYKIISETVANRLKSVLHCIVSPNQSAFILGRLITNNSLLAFETFHSMKRTTDGRKRFCFET